jgi:hypothetical protein
MRYNLYSVQYYRYGCRINSKRHIRPNNMGVVSRNMDLYFNPIKVMRRFKPFTPPSVKKSKWANYWDKTMKELAHIN